jgi:hypothetical protein
MTITSKSPYILYGSVIGFRSSHRTLSGAERAAAKLQRACRSLPGGNAYSDATVYVFERGHWELAPITEE